MTPSGIFPTKNKNFLRPSNSLNNNYKQPMQKGEENFQITFTSTSSESILIVKLALDSAADLRAAVNSLFCATSNSLFSSCNAFSCFSASSVFSCCSSYSLFCCSSSNAYNIWIKVKVVICIQIAHLHAFKALFARDFNETACSILLRRAGYFSENDSTRSILKQPPFQTYHLFFFF